MVSEKPLDVSSLSSISARNSRDLPSSRPPHTILEKITTARSLPAEPEDTSSSPAAIARIPTREDGTPYPSGAPLGLIVLALCLAVFLMALDNSIITTAIPRISDDFNSLSDVGWYGAAYLLTQASLQLLFGRFYTYLPTKLVFLAAISIFELGSLICGVAPNSVTLIVGRAIAGIGAAGIFSGGLLILAHSLPLAKRPLYTGLIGGMYGIASVAGPLLGGAFTDRVSWRWCFYINLPIGAVTLVVITVFYHDPAPQRDSSAAAENGGTTTPTTLLGKIRRFDPVGNALFMPAVVSLLLALQWGGTTYPWSSPRIIALFVVAVVLLAAFLGVQVYLSLYSSTPGNATLPLRILRNRSVWASGFFSFTQGSSFFIFIFYIPIWFQAVQGVSAVDSGIRNLPMLIANILGSIGAGALVTTFGYYAPFMLASTLFSSVGAGLMTTWTPSSPMGVWIGYQIILGLGPGFGFQQPLMAVQTVLDMADVPTGTALIVFLQFLGGALFIAVGQTVFTNRLAQEIVATLPGVDPAIILASGATNLKNILSADQLVQAIAAYNTALTTTFFVGVGLAVATLVGSSLVEWKSVKGKNIEMGMA
ncbi:major facilitator superfamily transporter [Microdochium bolleyi]|uniref:Major facilitator superfamily transporter n=1 Tax=Microdochium bolleyi TaxID=196109 RepID=A0A136IMQ8_9PEZI|nr:major facilitator superfamily transporter [Microdochium bolleyi]